MTDIKIKFFTQKDSIYRMTLTTEKTHNIDFIVQSHHNEDSTFLIKITCFETKLFHRVKIPKEYPISKDLIQKICMIIFEKYKKYQHKLKYLTPKNNNFLFNTEFYYPWIENENNIFVELCQNEQTIKFIEFESDLSYDGTNLTFKKNILLDPIYFDINSPLYLQTDIDILNENVEKILNNKKRDFIKEYQIKEGYPEISKYSLYEKTEKLKQIFTRKNLLISEDFFETLYPIFEKNLAKNLMLFQSLITGFCLTELPEKKISIYIQQTLKNQDISALIGNDPKRKKEFFEDIQKKGNLTTHFTIENYSETHSQELTYLAQCFFQKIPHIFVSRYDILKTNKKFKNILGDHKGSIDLDLQNISSHERLKILRDYAKIKKTILNN